MPLSTLPRGAQKKRTARAPRFARLWSRRARAQRPLEAVLGRIEEEWPCRGVRTRRCRSS